MLQTIGLERLLVARGCEAVKDGVKYPVAHSEACRQEVYERLFGGSDARVHEFVKRMSRGMEREEKCRLREWAQE